MDWFIYDFDGRMRPVDRRLESPEIGPITMSFMFVHVIYVNYLKQVMVQII